MILGWTTMLVLESEGRRRNSACVAHCNENVEAISVLIFFTFRFFSKNGQKKTMPLLKHQHLFHFWTKCWNLFNQANLKTAKINFIKDVPTFHPKIKKTSSKRTTSSNP